MISTLLLRADKALAGAPDELLTWGLLGVAGVCLLVALLGNPLEKAGVFAWAVLP